MHTRSGPPAGPGHLRVGERPAGYRQRPRRTPDHIVEREVRAQVASIESAVRAHHELLANQDPGAVEREIEVMAALAPPSRRPRLEELLEEYAAGFEHGSAPGCASAEQQLARMVEQAEGSRAMTADQQLEALVRRSEQGMSLSDCERVERPVPSPTRPSRLTLAGAVQAEWDAYADAVASDFVRSRLPVLVAASLARARTAAALLGQGNPVPVARWAQQVVLLETLGTAYRDTFGGRLPGWWSWQGDRLAWDGEENHDFAPALAPPELRWLRSMGVGDGALTAIDPAGSFCRRGVLLEPHWPGLRWSYARAMDPMRWPLAASWLIARLIIREFSGSDLWRFDARVRVHHAGHSVGTQALAAWLTTGLWGERILVSCDDDRLEAGGERHSSAVVLGAPTAPAMLYDHVLRQDDSRLDPELYDTLMRPGPYDVADYARWLARAAPEQVAANGLLFVVGDPEVHHQMAALIDADGRFERHKLTPTRPIVVHRRKAPWRPWGVRPPSMQRLITIWRRTVG